MSVCYACFFKQIYLNTFLYDFHDFFPPQGKICGSPSRKTQSLAS